MRAFDERPDRVYTLTSHVRYMFLLSAETF